MLNFISKTTGGGQKTDKDVRISTGGKNEYQISFDRDALKVINGGTTYPVALMVAIKDNRVYFVPSNQQSQTAFKVGYSREATRPNITIGKRHCDLMKFDGEYNFHFDDREGAYYIDRKFLLG